MAKKPLLNKAKFSTEQIERNLNALAARHGITLPALQEVSKSTTTIRVILADADAARLARAHMGADALVTRDDPAYALPPLPLPVVAKGLRSMQAHSRRARVPRIRTND
ncbi:hypothetical protein [Paraburkholderia sp. BCC1876]|uniref:hypothetical protein n=1 Tax=Paraburkholderia sp. BCC1876 TaxID=2676303 RepID=UPI0015925850|nr:hypothetical protein [Paraburkholderia sp. BCC1876]